MDVKVPPHERPRMGLRATSDSVEETLRELLDEDDPLHPQNYRGPRGLLWFQAASWRIASEMAERRGA